MVKLNGPTNSTEGGTKMSIPSVFNRIQIPLGPWLILKRATVACPMSDKRDQVERIDQMASRDQLTLLIIASEILPISSHVIYHMMNNAKRDIVEPADIVQFYAGDQHVSSIKEKIAHRNIAQMTADGQSFADRLDELGIQLDNQQGRLAFSVIDLGMKVRVSFIRSGRNGCNQFDGIINDVAIRNCVVPTDLPTPENGNWVVIHFGAMISEDSDDYDPIFQQQTQNETVQKWLSELQGSNIDCANLCGGFNLTQWVESRLGTEQV